MSLEKNSSVESAAFFSFLVLTYFSISHPPPRAPVISSAVLSSTSSSSLALLRLSPPPGSHQRSLASFVSPNDFFYLQNLTSYVQSSLGLGEECSLFLLLAPNAPPTIPRRASSALWPRVYQAPGAASGAGDTQRVQSLVGEALSSGLW